MNHISPFAPVSADILPTANRNLLVLLISKHHTKVEKCATKYICACI